MPRLARAQTKAVEPTPACASSRARATPVSTPAANVGPLEAASGAVGDVFGRVWTPSYPVGGRVVADIPAFNRELVAALAEQ